MLALSLLSVTYKEKSNAQIKYEAALYIAFENLILKGAYCKREIDSPGILFEEVSKNITVSGKR